MMRILFLVVCGTCLLDQSVGRNYYIKTGPGSPDLLTYQYPSLLVPVLKPDCDKNKGSESSENSYSESGESDSSESDSSSESGENDSSESDSSSESGESDSSESDNSSESRESDSSESDRSSESGESDYSKSSSSESKESAESTESKEESLSKEDISSSSEESERKKSKESSEESEEKKKEPKKKKKEPRYVFPPRTYDSPPRRVQQIVYSPLSSYSYMPYRSSYFMQPQVASYPMNNYRVISVPSTAKVARSYSSPVANRLVNSPVTKIVYTPDLSYPPASKPVVLPGARVYSMQGSWNSALSYFKK